MKNVQLRVGDDRIVIDSKEISVQSLNYSLKDIKNFGQRNASYTKPISVLQTKNTDRIFKALFNINSTGGYDISQKVYAEIIEDGVLIMKGSMQIDEITEDTYEVTIATNNLSLYGSMGDRFIVGNQDPADDVSLGGTPHLWNRDTVRSWMNSNIDASKNGEGYIYAFAAYGPNFKWPMWSFENFYLNARDFMDDYPVFPHLAVKQVFDKIFERYGYTYTMTSDIEDLLKEMYFVYNGEYTDLTTDSSKYAKYYFGDPTAYSYTDTTVQLTTAALTQNFLSSEQQPIHSIKGWTFQDSYLPGTANDVTGGHDEIFKYPSTKHSGTTDISKTWEPQRFSLPHRGNFTIDVSMYLYNSNPSASGTTAWSITTWNPFDGLNTTAISEAVTIPSGAGGYVNGSVTVSVSQKSFFYIHRSTDSDPLINLIFGPWSFCTISENNSWVVGNNTIELDDLLPTNYKQKDLIDDVLKMFNAFVTVDEIDEKKLHIKTIEDFYSTGSFRDWTEKVSEIKHKPIKNTFAKTTKFKFTDDSDIYTQDYKTRFPDGIYTEYVENDSEFGGSDNDITLSVSPVTMIAIPNSDSNAPIGPIFRPPIGVGYPIAIMSDDKQMKTAWRPRIAFINTIEVSTFPYGTEWETLDVSISQMHYISSRRDASLGAATNLFLGWDSENTYLQIPEETNETLYNRYYKEDIEGNLQDDARLITCKANLTANDIGESGFDDKIYIEHWKLGHGWYHLNSIKNYKPGGGLCDVELLKFPEFDASYGPLRDTNIVYRALLGESTTASSGSSSGSTGGGSSSSTLQQVTSNGNSTNNGIVFENASAPSSQVEVNVDPYNNLTIDGGLEVNEGINLTKDLSVGQDIYTDGSIHIAQDAHIEGSMDVDTNVKIGGTLSVTGVTSLYDVNVAGDISIGDTEFVDDTFGHYPFISGFTGTGYQLIRDADNNYRLEIDDLLVRGSLTAYELILHKIRALNGSLWVSSAVEAVWPGEASTYIPAGLYYGTDSNGDFTAYFYTDLYNNSLVADDYIRSQQFMGNNIHQLDWIVTDSSGTYIFVKNTPQDRTDGEWPDSKMGLSNIDASTFSEESEGYDIIWETDGEKVKTNYFTVEGPGMVYVAASWNYDATIEADTLRFRLLDGSDNNIADPIDVSIGSEILQEPFYITDTDFNGDASCYITVENDSDGHVMAVNTFNVDEVKDYTLSYRDVTGFTFVRRGNPTDPNRQGALYLTADDSNAPYIEVIDGMTGHDIASNNRKARLGKLDGLTWRDASISGYGLWSDSIYLTGGINAEAGTIGNFEIEGGQLVGTGTSGDKIILDPDTPSVILADASQSIVAEITNQPILSIDNIQSATEIEYDGTYADRYTDVAYQFAQHNSFGGAKYWRPDIYIKNHQTTGNTYLDASTSERATTYDIQVIADSAYTVNMYANIYASYLVPESSEGTWREEPDPPLVDEYIVLERNFYEIAGGWQINANTHFYDGADTSLGTSYKSLYGTYTGNYGRLQVVSNKSITPTDGSIYIKFNPEIKNGFYINNYLDVWEYNNYYDGMGWRWRLLYYVDGVFRTMDASVLFSVEIDELSLNGRIQKTQIGQDGILTYWDDTKYFTVNNRESPLIQSAGGWTHNLGTNSIRINAGGETASSSSPIALACNEQGWMASLRNKRNSNDAWGILLDTGNGTSTPANLIMFRDYNGNQVGLISHNSTNTFYGQSSDRREKGNIRDTSIDALSVINDIQVRNWEWNRTGKTDIGFVAQELVEVVPDAVIQPADPSDMWSVGSANLIPYLVKALQEANARIEQLETDVSILKSS